MTAWYDENKIAYPGSRILTTWKAGREAARVNNASADSGVVLSSDPKVIELFGLHGNSTAVTEQTAQRLSAVGACLGLRGDALSTLPLHHYKRTSDGRERVENSALWRLFNLSPINNWKASDMIKWWDRCCVLRGDAFTQILRNRNGEVQRLRPLHPDAVQCKDIGDDILYMVTDKNGKQYPVASDDMLHMTSDGFDGERSLSAIASYAKNSIGMGLSVANHSQKFFENGASPKHTFETEGEMSPDQIDQFREVYGSRYAGKNNTAKPMILTEGMKMRELSMSNVDAQTLEMLKFTVIDIARALRVPPVMVGAQETTSSWGTGVTEIKQGFVDFTLEPRASGWEQELNRKVVRNEDEFVEFQFKAFLRGDSETESKVLREAIGGSQGPGWLTTNEVRRIDNRPPIDGGDTIYKPKGNDEKQTATAN